jgi:hypothetical protein
MVRLGIAQPHNFDSNPYDRKMIRTKIAGAYTGETPGKGTAPAKPPFDASRYCLKHSSAQANPERHIGCLALTNRR